MFEIELIICIKMDLALNNLQKLICHKTQLTNLKNQLAALHIVDVYPISLWSGLSQ